MLYMQKAMVSEIATDSSMLAKVYMIYPLLLKVTSNDPVLKTITSNKGLRPCYITALLGNLLPCGEPVLHMHQR
jgi:hypothetical protein